MRHRRLTPPHPTSIAWKTTTITSVTSLLVPSFGAMENKHFISTKMLEFRRGSESSMFGVGN
jgi:hypothetical protein